MKPAFYSRQGNKIYFFSKVREIVGVVEVSKKEFKSVEKDLKKAKIEKVWK